MKAQGLKVAPWCKQAGVSSSALYNFLNGESDSLNQSTLEALARAKGVTISEMIGEGAVPVSKGVLTIFVRGAVEAGAWKEAVEWPEDDWIAVAMPRIERQTESSFALLVRGSSMNLEYPEGTYLVCVPIYEYDGELGVKGISDHLIFCRRGRDGLVESTVKELRLDESGRAWLWPKSTDPAHTQPIEVPWPPHKQASENGDGTEAMEITAVVVGSYKPRRSI